MDGPNRALLARRLIAARAARGWNKSELARRAGVVPSYIHRLEASQIGRPSIDKITLIAQALGVNIGDLTEPPRDPLAAGQIGRLERLFGAEDQPKIARIAAGLERHSRRQRSEILDIVERMVSLPESAQS